MTEDLKSSLDPDRIMIVHAVALQYYEDHQE